MMREEFEGLISQLIKVNYHIIESAYMRAPNDFQKKEFTEMFFGKGMEWVNSIIAKREEICDLEHKLHELKCQIEKRQAELEGLVS